MKRIAVFAAALRIGGLGGTLGWLTLTAIFLSAIALYYYMLILKQALVITPTPDRSRITIPANAALVLIAAAVLLVLAACEPLGGRGGGRPAMAQGKGTRRAGVADALAAIRSRLAG